MKKRLQLPTCKLHMELWDTAGAERFRSMYSTHQQPHHNL
jgi:GTPase SAR1 family protein